MHLISSNIKYEKWLILMQITAESLIWKSGSAQNAICSKIHKNMYEIDSHKRFFRRLFFASFQPSGNIKSSDTMSLLNGVYIGRDLMEIYYLNTCLF